MIAKNEKRVLKSHRIRDNNGNGAGKNNKKNASKKLKDNKAKPRIP